ncbi:MAG: SPOR domain-containing protein [Alphaproteobacteria bacterium]|nr:SPOR domain-containing protein [Alphaproteobacteria bacterium]
MAVDDDIDSLEAELEGLDDDDDGHRAKIVRFLPVILAVGALAIFSIVVIVAYSGDDDEVVVMNIQDIGPDTPAIKIEADSAGAPVSVEGQDNPAYNPMNQGTDDTQVAAITPPPEEPLNPDQTGVIKIPPPDAPVEDGKSAQAVAPAGSAAGGKGEGTDGEKLENLIASIGGAATQPGTPADQKQPAAAGAPATKIPEPTTQTAQAATTVNPPSTQKIPTPSPSTAGAGTTEFRTMAGVYRVQIASAKSEGLAQREWKAQVSKYPDVLSSLSLTVQRAVVKNRGTFYRVQGGPFPDRDAADSVCRTLKSRGQDCLVVRP